MQAASLPAINAKVRGFSRIQKGMKKIVRCVKAGKQVCIFRWTTPISKSRIEEFDKRMMEVCFRQGQSPGSVPFEKRTMSCWVPSEGARTPDHPVGLRISSTNAKFSSDGGVI